MKIVIAPDKFKGSLTGFEFCDAVEEGLKKVNPNLKIIKLPLADGGDGTAAVARHYIEGKRISVTAKDPLFRPIKTSYLYEAKQGIAYIEMAKISGLQCLAKAEQNCMHTTSLGTGELLRDAIEKGAKQLILGIGGSATNDGGMGMAQALGFRFLDVHDNELQPIGSNLIAVKRIDASGLHPMLQNVSFKVACDVSNPFYGKNGAAYIYAAQKGASKEEIQLLDDGLRNFAKVLVEELKIDVQNIAGSGAAGGLGGGALALLGGQLSSGIELIKELAHFDDAITDANWIITGEGKLDSQTLAGKTILGVLQAAKVRIIPVAALCGQVELSDKQTKTVGFDYIASISEGCPTLEEAVQNAYTNLVKAAEKFGNFVCACD